MARTRTGPLVRQRLADQLVDHLRRGDRPVAVISGALGSGTSHLLDAVVQELDPARLRPVRLDEVLQRDARRPDTGDEAASIVVVDHPGPLTPDERTELATTIASRRSGLVIAVAGRAIGRRLSSEISSCGGMLVELSDLDLAESAELLRQETGVTTTGPTLRFLHGMSGGRMAQLVDFLRVGLSQGWLTIMDERLVMQRPPLVLEAGEAGRVVAEVQSQLSLDAQDLMYRIVLLGGLSTAEATDMSRDPDTVFQLENLGLVRIAGDRVRPSSPGIELGVELSMHLWPASQELRQEIWEQHRDRSQRSRFAALGAGIACDEDEILTEAVLRLERGQLSHCRELLTRVPDGARPTALKALISALLGQPWDALRQLGELSRDDASSWNALGLEAYIRVVFLPDGQDISELLDRLRPLADEAPDGQDGLEALRVVADWTSAGPAELIRRHGALLERPRPGGRPSTARLHTELALVNAMARLGRRAEARERFDEIVAALSSHVPIVCRVWLHRRLIEASVLLGVDRSALRQIPWIKDFSAHGLPAMSKLHVQEALAEMSRGAPDEEMVPRIVDLRVQITAAMPLSYDTRELVELLELIKGTDARRGLLGSEVDSAGLLDPMSVRWGSRTVLALGLLMAADDAGLECRERLARTRELVAEGEWVALLSALVLHRGADVAPAARAVLTEELRVLAPDQMLTRFLIAWEEHDEVALLQLREALARSSTVHPSALHELAVAAGIEHETPGRARFEMDPSHVPPADIAHPLLDLLTPRERDVATGAAEGASNALLAQRLEISRRTVEAHLGRVYRKLGVRSRQELWAELS